MIKVVKSASGPRKFETDGATKRAEHCAEFDRDPAAYRAGDKKMDIVEEIYRNVKSRLKKIQHEKCCYCEAKFRATSFGYGDVEHFRPKKYAQQEKGAEIEYPGYYWLAYDWSNLFFSCEVCNRTHKRNLFPILDSAVRARNHKESIGREEPLLVNPGGLEDPRDHIRFHAEVPMGITPKGHKTICVLGLRRLNEDRRTVLARLKREVEITRLLNDDPDPETQQLVRGTRELLEYAVSPKAEFSSMARDFLASVGE